ncbi:MAG TPA: hypothetical protein VLS90_00440, partial [Thermodesulfobacteriota bacterium]|nr:hypothetical protein [Thermodesulfobacteriota bacterium]
TRILARKPSGPYTGALVPAGLEIAVEIQFGIIFALRNLVTVGEVILTKKRIYFHFMRGRGLQE